MKYSLLVRPEAQADVAETQKWYEERAAGLGRQFVEAVDEALASIIKNPLAFAAAADALAGAAEPQAVRRAEWVSVATRAVLKRNPFLGRWRITEMAKWGEEYRDIVVPAFIAFDQDRLGEFQFGTVTGWLDCRFTTRGGQPVAEFSWDGQSDNDPGCGRGWATLTGATLRGHIFIHCGEDSSFVARRETLKRSKKRRA